jgi:hypothetical protein
LIFNGKNEDVESSIIQLEVENHEQLNQIIWKDEERNAKVGIDIDGEHVPLHDDEVFGSTQQIILKQYLGTCRPWIQK